MADERLPAGEPFGRISFIRSNYRRRHSYARRVRRAFAIRRFIPGTSVFASNIHPPLKGTDRGLRSRTPRRFASPLRTMDPMCTRAEQLIPNVRRLGMRRRWQFFTGEARTELRGGSKEIKNGEYTGDRGTRARARARRKERSGNVAGPVEKRGPGGR